MNFASKYVLADSDVEYESICEDEFNEGMQISDSDSSNSDEDVRRPQARSLAGTGKKKSSAKKPRHLQRPRYQWRRNAGLNASPDARNERGRKRIFRKADTNVVSVTFDTLLSPGNMFAGDPVPCSNSNCSAILSHISSCEGQENKTWPCEFCGQRMPVDLEPEEIPATEDVTYLLAPAPSTASTSLGGLDRSLVIFCVDTSGSMCVTSEIAGKVKLRGTSQLQRLQGFNEGNENQFLPSQVNRNVTYVSRLQAMQAAVDHQLSQMELKHPDRRVALVAFDNEVTVISDGSQPEVVVAGDKLSKLEKLQEVTQDMVLPQAIKTTRKVLGDKVYSLEEGGATALGPALIVAINMAASHPGSKVILCTDGKANVGLGRLEGDGDKDERTLDQEALQFYTKTAEDAAERGVTVSVITIQGTDCKLVHLGTLADKTGGQVNIVDCLKLTEEFGNILADPVIATKVKATFLLHKELYVVDDNEPDKEESRVEQTVGNVKESSIITFEFAKRRANTEGSKNSSENQAKNADAKQEEEAGACGGQTDQVSVATTSADGEPMEKGEPSTAAGMSGTGTRNAQLEYPFQLQIEYVDAEGNKALRVITRKLPATSDRSVTEEAVNMEVLGAHAARKSADLALKGQYSHSRGVALMNQRLAWRHAHSDNASREHRTAYKGIFGKIKSMENCLQQRQMMEIQERGHTRSDSESDDEDDEEETYEAIAPHEEEMYEAPHQDQAQMISPKKSVASRLIPASLKRSKGKAASKHKKMHSERSAVMEDHMANVIYQFRGKGAREISAPDPEASSGAGKSGKSGKKST